MGVLFVVLTTACLAVAGAALIGDTDLVYVVAELTCGLAIAGYIATRLVAFPLLSADVGDWLDPLGLLSVTAEAVVVGASITALCTGAVSSGDDHRSPHPGLRRRRRSSPLVLP